MLFLTKTKQNRATKTLLPKWKWIKLCNQKSWLQA